LVRTKGALGLGTSSGSRYKVTARCVPEVSITSPVTPPTESQYGCGSSTTSSSCNRSNNSCSHNHVTAIATTTTTVGPSSTPPTQPQATTITTSTTTPSSVSFSQNQFYSFPNNTATNTNNINNIYNNKNNYKLNNNNNNNNKINNINNINNIKNLKNTISNQTNSKSKSNFDCLSHHTNETNSTILSSGATLVEEEDFNELTAVPTTATNATPAAAAATTPANIVIAANNSATTTINNDSTKGNNRKVSRHLPPLKLQSNCEPSSITPSAGQGPCSTIAATVRNVLQRQQASSTTSPTQQQQPTKSKRTATTSNITAPKNDDDFHTQANEHTPLFSDLQRNQQQLTQTPPTSANASTLASPNNSIIAQYQTNVLNTTGVAASTAIPNYNNSTSTTNSNHTFSTTAATTATTTTYSHNSKTTRSWPVIYRNPHHYDYEALYAPNAANSRANYYQQQQQYVAPSVTFKQNCYSNQFKQSIIYSSSNEDLTTINECASADGVVANGNGGRSSSGSSSIFGGGNSNPSCSNLQKLNQQQQQQTTCYYFSPSRHNSIYEHPSAVVASSLQFDPHTSAATTAAAAAAVESIRRSNSILLRNSSCSSKIMHQTGGGNLDSPTSLNSAMDVTSNVGSSSCCSSCCMGPPPVLFLFVTLLMTTSATAMLCAAIMTDHWEHVKWDRISLDRYSNRSNLQLEWIMEDKVAMLKPDKRADHRFRRDNLFLVPMHGGIWTLCIDLPLHEIQELRRHPKFPRSAPTCLNYLAGSTENARGEEQRNDWQHSESQTTLQPHLSTYGTI
ncbi:probable serine/threonine-protein kinase cdc7, partial [Lucilia cuprina]|uniref:probable serine/threonine-protein kinase cdc7 n=1 Tax=Lucilia cuprina TaxID=7375 RepID=UPI001F051B67